CRTDTTSYRFSCSLPFSFNATATTEIYTLSLHDALPIFTVGAELLQNAGFARVRVGGQAFYTNMSGAITAVDQTGSDTPWTNRRSEEHTSELQSRENLVCRLLLEKKKKINTTHKNNQKYL